MPSVSLTRTCTVRPSESGSRCSAATVAGQEPCSSVSTVSS